MLSRRRILLLASILAIGLVIGGVVALRQVSVTAVLPPVVAYPGLPAGFARTLAAAQAAARKSASDPAAVRRLARLYQANRLFREARACYGVLAATVGLDARDHYYLADMAQNESDLTGAQTELRSTLRLSPDYHPARIALAEALFKSGREDEAGKEYSAVPPNAAPHPVAALGLARLALQRGDEAGAVAQLEKLVVGHPEAVAATGLLAQILERRGAAERATALRQASRQFHEPVPPDPWLEALWVDCYDLTRLAMNAEQYFTAGQVDQAGLLLDRIEELDPANWVPPAVRGWSQELAGNHEAAAREYRQALAKGGDAQRICPLVAAPLLALGRVSEAAALLADYHARFPNSVPILRAYADVAGHMGDVKLARSLLTQVLQAEPYLYAPNMNLAGLLWQAGERDEAARCLLRVAAVFPDDFDSRGLLGQYYLEKSEPASAISQLEAAVTQIPKDNPKRERLVAMLGTAYRMAGSLAASQGQYARAVEFADLAIRLLPTELRAYALKANASLRLRQFPQAEAALLRMLALAPGDPTIQLHLGDAIYQSGDAARARPYWEKARQLTPTDDPGMQAALDGRLAGTLTPETIP